MPGYQTFKCTKCGKEIKYSPYKGFFRWMYYFWT
jgi:hypothetical protein